MEVTTARFVSESYDVSPLTHHKRRSIDGGARTGKVESVAVMIFCFGACSMYIFFRTSYTDNFKFSMMAINNVYKMQGNGT